MGYSPGLVDKSETEPDFKRRSNSGTGAPLPSGTPFSIAPGQTTEDVPAANASYQTNLVLSPIASVCFACHDTSAAMAHYEINGGSLYKGRTAALTTVETCILCHGPGRTADIKEVHSH